MASGSLFQRELGYCCLGMGIMGIMCYWYQDNFWLATIVLSCTFLLCAAWIHICRKSYGTNKEVKNTLMDQRQVFNNEEELLSYVTSISKGNLKAFLLVDKEGLTRVEGVITLISERDDIVNTSIEIDNRETVLLKEIIGINGLFRSDYSEC